MFNIAQLMYGQSPAHAIADDLLGHLIMVSGSPLDRSAAVCGK
mgnify:CR=1